MVLKVPVSTVKAVGCCPLDVAGEGSGYGNPPGTYQAAAPRPGCGLIMLIGRVLSQFIL